MVETPDNPESTQAVGPSLKSKAGGSREQNRIHAAVLAAILAAAPQLSCSGESDVTPDSLPANVTSEQVEKGKGEVHLFFDGYDWYFQGNYPENFKLQVFASNKPSPTKPTLGKKDLVYEDIVQVKEGKFDLHDYSGSDETAWITIRAFNENGGEITISPTPGPDGMLGVPYVANLEEL